MAQNKKFGVLLPPTVGYSIKMLFDIIARNHIDWKYYHRVLLMVLINFINWPFRTYERIFLNPRFNKKEIKEAPIFIIGHWRSGTTHLHNILCQDPQMGYTTTYQVVFPDTFYSKIGYFLFKNFTKLLLPGTRKGDNVAMSPGYPQEEEFALGHKIPISFYYWWMFPTRIWDYYQSTIRFQGKKAGEIKIWEEDYQLLIKKALAKENKNVFISKNPPHTARVKQLLNLFPKARFIHIHRNPVEVILSTRNFYDKMLPYLQLQDIDKAELNQAILDIYKELMQDYLDQKDLVPQGQLIEVRFEELEQKPKEVLNRVYNQLGLQGYNKAEPFFNTYLEQSKNYKKNKHSIQKSLADTIQEQCAFMMDLYHYSFPQNLEIIED